MKIHVDYSAQSRLCAGCASGAGRIAQFAEYRPLEENELRIRDKR